MTEEEQAQAHYGMPLSANNPFGAGLAGYSNPIGQIFKKNYLPHIFTAQLNQDPDVQRYAQVGRRASAYGVDTVRSGEERSIESARRGAAAGGLGRGYADQAESEIEQGARETTAGVLMSAQMEEDARLAQLKASLAQSLIDANKATYAWYLQKKAQKAAGRAGMFSMIGDILKGGATLAGAMIGGPAGAAGGAAVGGAAGGGQ